MPRFTAPPAPVAMDINKTSSAVHLIHKPTGIVVSARQADQFPEPGRLGTDAPVPAGGDQEQGIWRRFPISRASSRKWWGSQIRNYVFIPYTLVKDTRTGCETSQRKRRNGRCAGPVYQCLPHLQW